MAESLVIDLEPEIKDSLKIAEQVETREKGILSTVKERMKALASGAGAVGGKGLSSFAAMTSGGPIAGIAALGGPLAGIGAAIGSITSAVSKANPAAMKSFGFAIDDFIAVIGHALTPVIDVATGIIREFGSIFATLMPVIQPIINYVVEAIRGVVMPIISMLGDVLIETFKAVMPIVEPVLSWLVNFLKKYVVPGIKLFIDSTVILLNAIIKFYNWVSDVVKKLTAGVINLGRMREMGATGSVARLESSGAAVREAQLVGIAEFSAAAQIAAWRAARPAAERTANATESMAGMMREDRNRSNQQDIQRSNDASLSRFPENYGVDWRVRRGMR